MSCEYDATTPQSVEPVADFVDPMVVKTPEDKVKAERVLAVIRILREIYKDPMVVEEVNAAVATGYYVDETILLKDLLNPENSPVYSMEVFIARKNARGFEIGSFKRAFETQVDTRPEARQLNDDYFYEGGIYIYFPYHEYTGYLNQMPVVVGATVEADQAWAYQPYGPDPDIVNPPGHMILVNDHYASMNQTHIVGDGGVEVHPQYAQQGCPGNGGLRVSVGYIKVSYHQYDPFISFNDGGGAEIRIGLARGSQDGSTVTSFDRQIEVYVPRLKARRAEWVECWEDIETSWGTNYPRLLFAVYEKDPTSDKKNFSGTLEYINPSGQTITSNYSINVRTRNVRISENHWLRSYLMGEYTQFGHQQQYILGFAPSWEGNLHRVTRYSLPGSCY